DRGGDYNYECGLGLVGSSRDQTASHDSGPQRNQMFAECLIVDGFQRVDLGLGLAYLQNVDWYNGSNLNFSLLARWRITDRFWLTYRHWSNSGTVMPNRGRDRTMGGFVLVLP
ncbi:MAG TPA: hypothetical protein PLX85_00005, partial [Dehalococcoidia bacterium]|nr:hypothetical protein [Dehalococcoidia bacterium]